MTDEQFALLMTSLHLLNDTFTEIAASLEEICENVTAVVGESDTHYIRCLDIGRE